MGKYIKRNNNSNPNSNSNRDIASHTGVRTRARTLALQKASSGGGGSGGGGGGSYIQLRSRRLVKPTPPNIHKENLLPPKPNKVKKKLVDRKDDEASFGDNMEQIEGTERSIRETTPCSLIRNPDTISSPGSSTKKTHSTNSNYKVQIPAPRLIPTTVDMEEFFTEPEKQQQKHFIKKYNFDPVNDKPLPGRYEWLKMDN